MRLRLHAVVLTLVIFISFSGLSQGILKTEGSMIVNEAGDQVILKGMGLGGWMLMEGYMMTTAGSAPTQHEMKEKISDLIGEDGMKLFYEAWLSNHVTKVDIDSLASWGFNCIRLPMHYDLYTPSIQDEPVLGEITWLDKGFAMTDSLLSWCSDNEMYLVLDLHAAPGGQGYDAAISDYDDSKPSLWENVHNQDKIVALWKKLAERYSEEEWIGGYDLINETNWNMENNTALYDLYLRIVEAIREVDKNHIIYIEGNWFANDFTGLTPPFDDNMVYSFHKYWSTNDQASIQWVLDIRDTYNVPLWLGESGENSNQWFRNAIRLMAEHNIGWAWWPMKKVQTISAPYSITKNEGFQDIIDYWDGNGSKPDVDEAKTALMQLAEDAKIENCRFNPDVIHAMFKQVVDDVTMPYAENKIPGLIYATDFDIGANNVAYFDRVFANYHVSTGNYTAWNEGWWYRNDGVDIQENEDPVNSNGFNLGWIDSGEWMKYTVNVEQTGFYTINVRTASESGGGSFHFELDEERLTDSKEVASTGSWQTWETTTIHNVFIDKGIHTLKFSVNTSGFNLGSFEFVFNSVTGLTEEEKSILRIYPNPGNGMINIQSKEVLTDYQLICVTGKVTQSGKIRYAQDHQVVLDLSAVNPGMYSLVLQSKQSSWSRRIAIQ